MALLSGAEIALVVLVVLFAVCVDTLISWQSRRVSGAILVAYGSWCLIVLLLLTIASERLAGSGLLALYSLAAFLLLRGSAQLHESDILHWKGRARSESGLAVTSILILDRAPNP
ncbi:MAG: hypothetical protein J0H17_21955, partial [Rhizobiales bacterium]|nr:hypothetical protein [Hyphomicrobiales bacterium]